MITTLNNFITNKYIAARIKTRNVMEAVQEKLKEDSGNFFEEALKYILAFVVGALFLAGVYALIKNVVLPSLENKTEDMFNYTA
jgi:hypothetical protein